ncbi:putative DNA-binding domain-containing protein [Mucilaginibacter mali]|uniref:Putative DNA-binding domain-containing protein n=1 Tax=Mucilaginibacter mali TaxID=2740462 RepID=A0A7D4QLB1_9SPHI|nr:putative DNA-binding domain-containing protein [Mucilaginibacter mali]QKJ31110.1 putative DNA-binding domain-containing protein [Mucilaginibacter mali]
MSKLQTARLQYWLKDILINYGTLPQKLYTARQQHGLDADTVVANNGTASVYSRLNVYTTGYKLRLVECLRADFPILKKFVGDVMFDTFADAAIAWQPSTTYTLTNLGLVFLRFLESTKPVNIPDGIPAAMFDFPAEIARVERARQEAIRAAGDEGQNQISGLDKLDNILFMTRQISVTDCLRLVELKFPLKKFFMEMCAPGAKCEMPAPVTTFMAVSRKNYRITMEELPEWQYRFLQLCRQGLQLLEAVKETSRLVNRSEGELLAELYVWMPFLVNNGFIVLN